MTTEFHFLRPEWLWGFSVFLLLPFLMSRGKTKLAARGPGQELAQRDEPRKLGVIQPPLPDDQFVPEIGEMGDRSTE